MLRSVAVGAPSVSCPLDAVPLLGVLLRTWRPGPAAAGIGAVSRCEAMPFIGVVLGQRVAAPLALSIGVDPVPSEGGNISTHVLRSFLSLRISASTSRCVSPRWYKREAWYTRRPLIAR